MHPVFDMKPNYRSRALYISTSKAYELAVHDLAFFAMLIGIISIQTKVHFTCTVDVQRKYFFRGFFLLFSPIKGHFDGHRFAAQDDGRSRGMCNYKIYLSK